MNTTGDVKWFTAAEGLGLGRVRSRRGMAAENEPKPEA
jgi:hypothetical protein